MAKTKRILQKETLSRNFLGELFSKEVGTNEIESLAKRVRGEEGRGERGGRGGETRRINGGFNREREEQVKEVKRILRLRILALPPF